MVRRVNPGLAAPLILLAPALLFSQVINTVVGNAINDNRPALQTPLVRPDGLAVDNNGALIVADSGTFVIRRISGGNATVIAGSGNNDDDAIPIPAKSADLDYPYALAVAADGTIYFTDVNTCSVRKITPAGLITTVAGNHDCDYYGDGGRATQAAMGRPFGVAVDRSRNLLYISDSYNSVIRRVNLATGIIDTFAGTGQYGHSGDGGPATQAKLDFPGALAVDSSGNLFFTDDDPTAGYEGIIRKVTPGGIISGVLSAAAGLPSPDALAFNAAGNLYVADYYANAVFRVGTSDALTLVAGGVSVSPSLPKENVPATSEFINNPTGLAFDSAGNLYISEEGANIVRRVDTGGTIHFFAGDAANVLDGTAALNAPLDGPSGMVMSASGDLYIADTLHNRIRKVSPASGGTISTVLGNGIPYPNVDGTVPPSGFLSNPVGVSLDPAGTNLYFTEFSSVVRKLNLGTRQLTTVAGNFNYGYSGDGGPATSAKLANPWQAVVAPNGDVYISDRDNACVRRVRNGIVTTAAGICSFDSNGGYSGDGGPATQAQLSYPEGLAFDKNGDLLIADAGNSVVRRLNLATGILTRVAGIGGEYDYSGDLGPPLEARLGNPAWLAVSSNGTIFISDESNDAVRYISNNVIDTIAGIGEQGFFGDGGQAFYAWLNAPRGLALDSAGNLFISDSENNRVRRVDIASARPPALSVTPSSLTFRVSQNSTQPPSQFLQILNSGDFQLAWQLDARLPTSGGSGTFSGGAWLCAVDFSGAAPSLDEIGVTTGCLNPVQPGPGTYQGQITISAPGASGSPKTIPVTLIVDPPVASSVALSTNAIYFEAAAGGNSPPAKILSITNGGSGTLNWTGSFTPFRGGNWLSLSRTSGSTQAGSASSTVSVTANPASLAAGFYLGQITVANQAGGTSQTVLVGLFVSNNAPTILTSVSNFNFVAAQGSNFVPPQSFTVLNVGQGSMNWQIQTTIAQGNWLRLSRTSGTSDAVNQSGSPIVTLSVDPSGLAPGTYGALLQITAPGARNTPQSLTVRLRVLAPGDPPVPSILPAGLTFAAVAGGSSQTQEITATTSGGGALTFSVGTRLQNGSGWLTASPTGGSLSSSSDQPKVRVQVNPASLTAGVYRGSVTFSFSNGTVTEVGVALIVRPQGTTLQSAGDPRAACAPTEQVIQSTRLGNNFALPTGWPSTMIAVVFDNCGNPVTNSTVSVSFSSGDPTLILQNLGGGVYSKDWVPSPTSASNAVQISIRSVNPVLPEKVLQLTGGVASDTINPSVTDNGIVNGASFAASKPVSPGSIISIFGSNMANAGACFGGNCPATVPLPIQLGGASVKIGGIDAPLFYSGPGQINAQVPFELAGTSSADVVVSARGLFSSTRTVQIDNNEPGIFVIDGARGAVLISNTDNLAQPSGSVPGRNARAASRGDFITIYCSGLGPVSDPPASGTAAGSNPLSRATTPVTVSIGGVNATNIGFAGLSPGFVGLYQVDVQVPSNVAPGSAVTVKVTQNGVDSNQVTIAVN